MSLDVYLTTPEKRARTGSGIFVREDGATRELSRAEWDEKFPGREPVVVKQDGETDEAYSSNITHNLGAMANAAGIYDHLWQPETIGIGKAYQLIAPLEKALVDLKADPERFKKHNPSNGWGTYEIFVSFVKDYLDACREHPDANVSVSR